MDQAAATFEEPPTSHAVVMSQRISLTSHRLEEQATHRRSNWDGEFCYGMLGGPLPFIFIASVFSLSARLADKWIGRAVVGVDESFLKL
jgi:hypothetical protein